MVQDGLSGEVVGKWRQVYEESEFEIRYSTKSRRFILEVTNLNQAKESLDVFS